MKKVCKKLMTIVMATVTAMVQWYMNEMKHLQLQGLTGINMAQCQVILFFRKI